MSLPDKCPFCGAGVIATGDGSERSERWVSFDCFTQVFACDPRPTQSESCKSAERARLAARVAELEAENKSLRDRFSDADTERNGAQAALKAAFARVAELEARCKRLEEAGDKMADVLIWSSGVRYKQSPTASAWRKAKEAKP